MAENRDTQAPRPIEDLLLEAAYRAEFAPEPLDANTFVDVGGKPQRGGDLRARALSDLADRIAGHGHLRRADETARIAALRFVERRLAEGEKVLAYDQSGSFHGFLRRVLSNLLLDWLRSPAGKAELRRVEHDAGQMAEAFAEDPPPLPVEEYERARRLTLHHLVAVRMVRSLPPGRGIPLRLALWPAFEHEPEDITQIGSFAHCHETSKGQAEGRACDAGKRCTTPTPAWRSAYEDELTKAKEGEPEGLSRRSVAVLTRIGDGKPMAKREGAICERISKGRLQLVEELRRAGIRGAE